MSLNLIGVIRHSTDEQIREGHAGVERQKKDIESVQRTTGANIIRTIEVIESGARVLDNKKFQQVFRDLADPSVHGVACSAVDRLIRPDKFGDMDGISVLGDQVTPAAEAPRPSPTAPAAPSPKKNGKKKPKAPNASTKGTVALTLAFVEAGLAPLRARTTDLS